MTLLLLCGCALVAYGRWARPLMDAEQAIRDGKFELALEHCKTGEARFDKISVAKQLFSSHYQTILYTEVWLLYRLKQYDATIEKAGNSPEGPLPHFWAGCAFFEKARQEEKPEARLGWLSRSEEEFHKALELNPGDWDAKFNNELAKRLLAELRKQPKNNPPLMKLLRPEPKDGDRVVKKTG